MVVDIRAHAYTNTFESIRTMAQLLGPDDLEWETEIPLKMAHVPFILHIGCNVHYTLFLPRIAQKILRLLNLEFVTVGGPENCCGALQMHLGPDLEQEVATKSILGFKRAKPKIVLDVCPRCSAGFAKHAFDSSPIQYWNIAELIVEHLDELKERMQPINKRVVVHYHDCNEPLQRDWRNILTILNAIPGIEILPAQHARGPATHCTIASLYKDYKEAATAPPPAPATSQPMSLDDAAKMFAEAKLLGADIWVAPYHSCYWRYMKMQLEYGIEIHHYLSLLAMSLGISFQEPLKELRLLNDVDAAMKALQPKMAALGYREEIVRPFVQRTIYF